MNAFDEERLARLIRALPPAPEAWVRAAQELPFASAGLDRDRRSGRSRRRISGTSHRRSRGCPRGRRLRARPAGHRRATGSLQVEVAFRGQSPRGPARPAGAGFPRRGRRGGHDTRGGSVAALVSACAAALLAKIARASSGWPEAPVCSPGRLATRTGDRLVQEVAEEYEAALRARADDPKQPGHAVTSRWAGLCAGSRAAAPARPARRGRRPAGGRGRRELRSRAPTPTPSPPASLAAERPPERSRRARRRSTSPPPPRDPRVKEARPSSREDAARQPQQRRGRREE